MPFQPHSMPGLADPDDEMMTCALLGCGRTFRKGDAHNLGHVYLHAAGNEPPRMCEAIEHFTCSHEHAVQVAQTCLNEHPHAPWPGVADTDRWQHPALAAPALPCEHAGCAVAPAAADSHAIAVLYRMPGPGYAAHTLGIYAGCCEEHAKQAAAVGMRDHSPAARHHSRRILTQAERQQEADAYYRACKAAQAAGQPEPDMRAFMLDFRRTLAERTA